MPTSNNRSSIIIDRQVQLAVAFRVGVYLVASILFVTLSLTFWKTFVSEGGLFVNNFTSTFTCHLPVFATLLLLLPFAIFDSLRITHRFAGPIYRLRKDLQAFRNDDSVRTHFRDSDFLQDLPDSINEILDQIRSLKNKCSSAIVDDEVRV